MTPKHVTLLYSHIAFKDHDTQACDTDECVVCSYECQEKDGIFMLAFHHTRAAMEWGLTLQLGLMEVGPQTAGPPAA